jgi:hypothetical protein
MSDKKLDKLIESYKYTVRANLIHTLQSYKIEEDKARQAIVDYVEKEKQYAVKNVRDAFVNAINRMGKE